MKRSGRRRSGGGMVVKREASATRPSRKSTRKSANRARAANKIGRRIRRAKHSPRARASRAQLNRARSRGAR